MAVSPNSIVAPSHIHALLDRLHRRSEEEEAAIKTRVAELRPTTIAKDHNDSLPGTLPSEWTKLMSDKFIALDQDKCQFLYQQIRATGATNIVEAGTSYGVSTIYLALAVAANKAASGKAGVVIGTEHEPEKASKAREYWSECGENVEEQIDLRVGDILETLKVDMPRVDMLLLDIWTPLALPILKLVQPRMRPGAMVFTDNTISSAKGYAELLAYLREEESGFSNMTLPFNNGLEMSVYLPQ